MHDLYVEQGIKQVSALVGHLRQDSETGRMMQIELHWCQVQSGTSSQLLADTASSIDYIETCWIMGIRDFLRTYDFKLDLTDESVPHVTQRVGDEFIMDAFRERGECNATQLQRLNACRMFLQVVRVSDIATADGKRLRHGTLTGINDGTFQSATRWPRQGRPPKEWWTCWKNKLQRVFSSDGNSSSLRRPLGGWNGALNIDEWTTTTNTINGRTEVYERIVAGKYKIMADNNNNRTGQHRTVHADYGFIDSLPAGSVPAELGPVAKNRMRRVYSAPYASAPTLAPPTSAASFVEHVTQQPEHIRRLVKEVDKSEGATQQMAALLKSGSTLHAGTDGGLMKDSGTFGFAWSDGTSIKATGKGHTTGGGDSMSSTRAELSGIFAALTYARLVLEYTSSTVKHGTICVLHCDSRAALQRVESFAHEGFGTSWRCRANYDLEVAIKACLTALPFAVQWKWVRGHASRRKKRENFTWPEVLNSQADEMATAARDTKTPKRGNLHWPEQTISLHGPNGRITGHLGREIRYCCLSRDITSYWKDRYNWTAAQAKTLDTASTKAVSSKLSAASTRRIVKLRCGWLPVNNRESRSDPDQPPGCPACSPGGLVPETVDRLFRCCATSRRKAISEAFTTRFRVKLREFKTAECIISAIKTGALAWIADTEIPTVESLNLPDTEVGRMTARAYKEQSDLGWNVLFRGFWAKSWRLAQEEQYRQKKCCERQDTGEQWSTRVQMWFIDLFEALWGLRNVDQHGCDAETERLVRVSKCERAIRRLYDKGKDMDDCECHPFRDPIDDLLSKQVNDQELWVLQTEQYLPKALRRMKHRARNKQRAMTEFFPRRT